MATTQATEIREAQQFIGGEWVDAAERPHVRGPRPLHRRRRRARGRPAAATTPAAQSRPPPRFPDWSQTPPGGAAAHLPQGGRPPRGAQATRSSSCWPARPAQLRLRHVPAALRAGPAAPGGGAPVRAARAGAAHRTLPGSWRWACASPVGVVGAIAPWNAALILSARSIAAPLALGNTVVLKPSEWSPIAGGLALGRDLRRGRPAARRPQRRHARTRRGGADRRRARRAPGGAAASTSPARPRRAGSSPRRPAGT